MARSYIVKSGQIVGLADSDFKVPDESWELIPAGENQNIDQLEVKSGKVSRKEVLKTFTGTFHAPLENTRAKQEEIFPGQAFAETTVFKKARRLGENDLKIHHEFSIALYADVKGLPELFRDSVVKLMKLLDEKKDANSPDTTGR